AVRRIRETGVDGVLIGRAAVGYPWIFRAAASIRAAVHTPDENPMEPSVSIPEKLSVAIEHAELFERYRGRKSFRFMRKYLAAYCCGFPNAIELRRRLVLAENLREVESILQPVVCA
ncbi:MAG TPA: tRNA-dihydrouridine synthase, partial [Nitrospiria bacterium]